MKKQTIGTKILASQVNKSRRKIPIVGQALLSEVTSKWKATPAACDLTKSRSWASHKTTYKNQQIYCSKWKFNWPEVITFELHTSGPAGQPQKTNATSISLGLHLRKRNRKTESVTNPQTQHRKIMEAPYMLHAVWFRFQFLQLLTLHNRALFLVATSVANNGERKTVRSEVRIIDKNILNTWKSLIVIYP